MFIKIPSNSHRFTKRDKIFFFFFFFFKSVLVYIQTSTVQTNLSSWVYIVCSLPVNIYLRTICLTEFTVAWQNSKPVSCKMHAFLKNAINFALLYSGFV